MRLLKLVVLLSSLMVMLVVSGCGKSGINESGISENTAKYVELTQPGYYKGCIMQPDGKFFVREKVADEKADTSGLVYKVEMNDKNKPAKISTMYGGTVISHNWQDTKGQSFNISSVTMEYQDGYVKYNFRNTRAAAKPGYYGAYAIRYKIDDNNRAKVAYFYNKEGEQAATSLGYAQMIFSYQDNGQLAKVGYAGIDGNRVTTVKKEYETRFSYDKAHVLPVSITNYGKDESMMVDSSTIAKITYDYDAEDRVVEIRHYGADENLKEKKTSYFVPRTIMQNTISAGAITKYSYEGHNRAPSRISFLGKDEQPVGVKSWGNIATLVMKYNDLGNMIELASMGPDDSPVALDTKLLGDNIVKLACSYDDKGNLSRMAFYGRDDTLVLADKLKAAESKFKHDEKRRETEKAYFGTGEEPVNITLNGHTYHRVVKEYNDDDEVIALVYYDMSDNEVARDNPKEQKNAQKEDVVHPPTSTENTSYSSIGSTAVGLGAVSVGSSYESVKSKLGGEIKSFSIDNDGYTHHYFRDVEVLVSKDKIVAVFSNSSHVATKGNVRQGDSLKKVLDAYGKPYAQSTYGGLELYEYKVNSPQGDSCLLRFAIRSGIVDYISIRIV